MIVMIAFNEQTHTVWIEVEDDLNLSAFIIVYSLIYDKYYKNKSVNIKYKK